MKSPFVYILANKKDGALYIGVTSDLIKRIWQHRSHLVDGHSEKYNITQLVYFEQHETMDSAIVREKQMKKWNRQWQVDLIEENNPQSNDLWSEIV